ncbi:MAG: NAD(P) transhydrogenase subunit alpha [Anaerolineae bacterium]|nr:NAD(P) transhydrogenase subunit alpha [Anaerolineae bacterium]
MISASPALADPLAQEGGSTVSLTPVFLAFILALSIFLGFELISKVPATLHTPLMSGSNAISGISLVGALIAAGHSDDVIVIVLGVVAVATATINVVGGYLVTDRMLEMFKKKEE